MFVYIFLPVLVNIDYSKSPLKVETFQRRLVFGCLLVVLFTFLLLPAGDFFRC